MFSSTDIFFQLKYQFIDSVYADDLLGKFQGIIDTVEADLTDDIVCNAPRKLELEGFRKRGSQSLSVKKAKI